MLRNIQLTGPYMHNGVFERLEEVIDFYNDGGGIGLGLNVPHQTLPGDSLKLTDDEKADLIEFLKALTDNPFDKSVKGKLISDSRISNFRLLLFDRNKLEPITEWIKKRGNREFDCPKTN